MWAEGTLCAQEESSVQSWQLQSSDYFVDLSRWERVQTATQIKAMLADAGLSPKKALGQNFLIDANLVRKLVDAAGVGQGDVVLEVGPGTGTLTEALLARGCVVVASELDDALSDMLATRLAAQVSSGQLVVIRGDCLARKSAIAPALIEALGTGAFTLVANLPYHAATPLMLQLLVAHPRCRGLFVTVQREVADRFLASAGTHEYGSISVVAQLLAVGERLATLPPECFWPRPEVTSAMLGMTRLSEPRSADPVALAEFCKVLFASRRKQLGSVLGRSIAWPAGVEPMQRAEVLTPDQIEALRLCVLEAKNRQNP